MQFLLMNILKHKKTKAKIKLWEYDPKIGNEFIVREIWNKWNA